MVRYPGKIKPGSVSNEIVQHHDWLPTFLELAGNKTVVEDLKKGVKAIGRTYKNHIDGVSLLELPDRQERTSRRERCSCTSRTTATPGDSIRQLEDRLHGTALQRHHG